MIKMKNKQNVENLIKKNQSNKKNVFVNIGKLLIIIGIILFFVWLFFIRVGGPIVMGVIGGPYLLIIGFILRIIGFFQKSIKKKLG